MTRHLEPGWTLAAMHDPRGRRGLWYRATKDARRRIDAIEVCGGREGDDAYARLVLGATLGGPELAGLLDALERCAWMRDTYHVPADDDRVREPTVAAIVAVTRERDAAKLECEELRARLAALTGGGT